MPETALTSFDLEAIKLKRVLRRLGFAEPKIFTEDHWAAIIQVGSFWAIVDGNLSALAAGYNSRWHYGKFEQAAAALDLWGGEGEPQEWKSKRLTSEINVWP